MVEGGTTDGRATPDAEPLLLLVEAGGCRLALRADLVDAVFERNEPDIGEGEEAVEGRDEQPIQWRALLGLPDGRSGRLRILLRTRRGHADIAADRLVGIRRVPLVAASPRPTLLRTRQGRTACHLLSLDGQPVFLLDPGALAEGPLLPPGEETFGSSPIPQPVEGEA